MDKASIIEKLRAHEPELKAAGVAHVFLHGSYARGTMVREDSDVDIIAEFYPSHRLSLLDMVAIENQLADLLGVRVDLSPAKSLKAPIAAKASREAVLAFQGPILPLRDIVEAITSIEQFIVGNGFECVPV